MPFQPKATRRLPALRGSRQGILPAGFNDLTNDLENWDYNDNIASRISRARQLLPDDRGPRA